MTAREDALTVSVAMATCNGAAYLDEQLASIARQERPPDELVACDDGSGDGTLEILKRFARDAPFPVRIEENETRLGVTRNFEKAVRLCRGDVIFYADQDDVWATGKTRVFLEALRRRPEAGFAFSDGVLVDDAGRDLGERVWDFVGFPAETRVRFTDPKAGPRSQLRLMLRTHVALGTTVAFRADLRPFLLPYHADWGHDGWVTTGSLVTGRPGVAIPDPLIRYRRHPGQAWGEDYAASSRPWRRALWQLRHRRLTSSDKWRFVGGLLALRRRALGRATPRRWTRTVAGEIDDALTEWLAEIRHIRARNRIRTAEGEALRTLLREWRSGRYHRLSNGWKSAAADLLQAGSGWLRRE